MFLVMTVCTNVKSNECLRGPPFPTSAPSYAYSTSPFMSALHLADSARPWSPLVKH